MRAITALLSVIRRTFAKVRRKNLGWVIRLVEVGTEKGRRVV